MIPNSELQNIIVQLIEKSRKNQVNWQVKSLDDDDQVYVVVFGKSRLGVLYKSPAADADYILVQIVTADGVLAGRWMVTEGEDPKHEWSLARTLYEEADRCVTGWDKIVNDINQALSGDSEVGQVPKVENE